MPPTTDVLYDGGCGLCRTVADWLRAIDSGTRLRLVDIVADWDRIETLYPGVHRDACLDEMHVVEPDGRITTGFDGFRTIAWRVPLLRLVAPLLSVPGVPWAGRRVYRYVATHRSTTCRVPGAGGTRRS